MTTNVPSTQVVTAANLVFDEGDVRIYMIDGEPWFVLRDLLKAMGTQTRTNDILPVIKDTFGDGYVTVVPISDRLGRIQNVTMVNEAAMTFVVSQGKTETSKALNRKIHQEILPSIRKTGKFEVQPETREQLFQRAFLESQKMLEEKDAQIAAKSKVLRKTITSDIVKFEKLKEQQPKVEFHDEVIGSDAMDSSLSVMTKKMGILHPNLIIKVLKNGIAYGKRSGKYKWLEDRSSGMVPVNYALENEFLRLKSHRIASGHLVPNTQVTAKGYQELKKLFPLDNLPPELKCAKPDCKFCRKHFGT
jgi:prophage antirepressor-like protein